jgi:hypothetical protein
VSGLISISRISGRAAIISRLVSRTLRQDLPDRIGMARDVLMSRICAFTTAYPSERAFALSIPLTEWSTAISNFLATACCWAPARKVSKIRAPVQGEGSRIDLHKKLTATRGSPSIRLLLFRRITSRRTGHHRNRDHDHSGHSVHRGRGRDLDRGHDRDGQH